MGHPIPIFMLASRSTREHENAMGRAVQAVPANFGGHDPPDHGIFSGKCMQQDVDL
jgi:hypothetical protein